MLILENIINSILEKEQNGRESLENAIKERNQIIADAKAEEENNKQPPEEVMNLFK